MTRVVVAVIYIGNGSPDPYTFNDAMIHVASTPHETRFDWVDMQEEGKPTHYIVHNSSLTSVGCDSQSIIEHITEALTFTQNSEDLSGIQSIESHGIGLLDLNVQDNEVMFTIDKYPDIWIHAIWRD